MEDDQSFDEEEDVSLNPTYSEDRESIHLLTQIFPELPIGELRRIHTERMERERSKRITEQYTPPRLTARLNSAKHARTVDLPEDFLRLPSSVAVLRLAGRRRDDDSVVYRYEALAKLEEKVVKEMTIKGFTDLGSVFTRAVFRDPQMGLGMTLACENGQILVHSIPGGKQHNNEIVSQSPSLKAGIQPGDFIFGFNGQFLMGHLGTKKSNDHLLQHAVDLIRHSPDPVVIHCRRRKLVNTPASFNTKKSSYASLLDETQLDSSNDEDDEEEEEEKAAPTIWSTPSFGRNGEPRVHPLIELLTKQGLANPKEEMELSASLAKFNERAWDLEASQAQMIGIRKCLCVRLLNYFSEGTKIAYTLWIYDVESGQEWYAPIRYYDDFADLKFAVTSLIPDLGKIPFPREHKATNIFGSPRANAANDLDNQAWQLEKFIRTLCCLLYETRPHKNIGEVAVHVQSFLGCEAVHFDMPPMSISTWEVPSDPLHEEKTLLKRSFQCYVYRAFLLKPLAMLVDDFVKKVRQNCPSLQDLESIEAHGIANLQQVALNDLATLEKFLDFLQSTILQGGRDDFRSITSHTNFLPLRSMFHGKRGEIAWNELVREAVREQVEIEAYVPLRSVVSRWLVNGWRHEDMEAHFKINELRKRPPNFFGVPRMSDGSKIWMSAATILKENVERSTLPCAKLRAIVEAAREIARICASHNEKVNDQQTQDPNQEPKQLGADQFLPILIYCVVVANIERPCALCVLLRALCDKKSRIGEVGYYLASFEATVVHVRDFDLSEDTEHMRSFLSVNLDAD